MTPFHKWFTKTTPNLELLTSRSAFQRRAQGGGSTLRPARALGIVLWNEQNYKNYIKKEKITLYVHYKGGGGLLVEEIFLTLPLSNVLLYVSATVYNWFWASFRQLPSIPGQIPRNWLIAKNCSKKKAITKNDDAKFL